jgi:calreticulin
MKISLLVVLIGLVAASSATVYFKETFDGNWESRWVQSKSKESEGSQGTFELSHGKYFGDAEADKGMLVSLGQVSTLFPKV